MDIMVIFQNPVIQIKLLNVLVCRHLRFNFFCLQAEFAPLMAALIGVPFPLNSVVKSTIFLSTLRIKEKLSYSKIYFLCVSESI